jgi:hypothetical protein
MIHRLPKQIQEVYPQNPISIMATHQNINKERVVQAIIETLEKNHENPNIRALYAKGFEAPNKIITKGNEDKGYIPDVIYSDDEITELYEIELDKKVEMRKWKLFSLFTKMQKGQLNIVTHQENLPYFRELLKTNNIKNAKLIYF